MKVKLKNGRTGIVLNRDETIATINLDANSDDAGGITQIPVTEILEENNSADVTEEKKAEPAPATEAKPEPGVMEILGNAALLKPLFVASLIEALKSDELKKFKEERKAELEKEFKNELAKFINSTDLKATVTKKTATKKKAAKKK